MRLLHTADWHVGRTIRGLSRAEEHREVLREIASVAREEDVDMVVVAGDLFDSASPSPEAEQIVYDGLLDLASSGADVIVVAGNHDHPRRLRAVAPLLNRVRVHVCSEIARPDAGGVLELKLRDGKPAKVVMIPFISQRHAIRADELMAKDAADNVQGYNHSVGRIIDVLCKGLDQKTVNLAVAHLHIHGGLPSGSERSAHVLPDYYVYAEKFPACLNYVALGHLHAPQSIAGRSPLWYSGSPLQLDFGETEVQNSVLIVETEPGLPAQVQRRALSSGRKLMVLKGTLRELESHAASVGNAYLKLMLNEPKRIGLAEEAREVFPNAVHVEVVLAQCESAARAEAMEGLTPNELFAMYLRERGLEDERLVVAFKELQEKLYASTQA